MTEYLSIFGIDPKSGALLILLLVLTILISRIVRDDENSIEWWQFIATRGPDGKNYGDLDKLGKVVGIVIGSWVMVAVVNHERPEISVIFGIYLAFVGGIAGYSAYLRASKPPAEPPKEEK